MPQCEGMLDNKKDKYDGVKNAFLRKEDFF